MAEIPDAIFEQAAQAALEAEIAYARTARKAVWTAPARDQVTRLIKAAWPVLDAARKDGGDD